MIRSLTVLCLLMTNTAFAEPEFTPLYDQDLPPLAVSIDRSEDGAIKTIVVSEWVDRVGSGEDRVYYRYRQGYDYQKKEGFIRVLSLQNELLSERRGTDIGPGVAREELLNAFEIFKQDPEVRKRLDEAVSPIRLHGGFNFEGAAAATQCVGGWRCVLIMAHTA